MVFEQPNRGAAREGAAAPAATPTTPSPQRERQAATIRYLDRVEIAETFADSITGVVFDGQTLRLEFAVTRLDEIKPDAPITGRRYPACRVVLPPTAAIDLINRMQQIAAALAQAGVTRAAARPGEAAQGA